MASCILNQSCWHNFNWHVAQNVTSKQLNNSVLKAACIIVSVGITTAILHSACCFCMWQALACGWLLLHVARPCMWQVPACCRPCMWQALHEAGYFCMWQALHTTGCLCMSQAPECRRLPLHAAWQPLHATGFCGMLPLHVAGPCMFQADSACDSLLHTACCLCMWKTSAYGRLALHAHWLALSQLLASGRCSLKSHIVATTGRALRCGCSE
jgi:hypothetical protein